MIDNFSRLPVSIVGGNSKSPLDMLVNSNINSFTEAVSLTNDATLIEINKEEPDLEVLMYTLQLKSNLQSFMQRIEKVAFS
jgi:hypothetical protein